MSKVYTVSVFLICVLLLFANSAIANVLVTKVTLNKTTLSLNKGSFETLVASVYPTYASNKVITWSSSNSSIATVDSSGKVTSVANGDCTITVTTDDGGFTAACQVNVYTVQVTGIILGKTSLSLLKGTWEKLIASTIPNDSTNKAVTWSSSNTSIATVDSIGYVKGVGNGDCIITATSVDGGFTTSCKVNIYTIPVTGMTLNKSSLSLNKGSSQTLVATFSPTNATNKTINWSSSNTSVATASYPGSVYGVGNGDCIITATTVDGGFTASCQVNVYSVPVTGLTLSMTTLSLRKNASQSLAATISPSDATNKTVTWSSSNASVATVSSSGSIKAVFPGTCTITARTNDGGFTATCQVNVYDVPVTGITLNKITLSLSKNNSQTLIATVYPSDSISKGVKWASTDAAVATVSSSGSVTGVNPGTSIISAITTDGGFIATCEVTVIIVPVSGVNLDKTILSIKKDYSTHILTATVSPADASNKIVRWSSSDSTIASVSYGQVKSVNPGTCTITAKSDDGGFTGTCQVIVLVPVSGVTLDKTTLSLTRGVSQTLIPNVLPSDAANKAVTWYSSNKSIATVSSLGVVTGVELGDCTITATTVDMSYTATCQVNVGVINVSGITLNKTTLTLYKASQEKLIPNVQPENADYKFVTWSSSDNNIATVDENGVVTAVEGGACVITATTVDCRLTATCIVNVKSIPAETISECDTNGWAYDTAIKDNYAYLADGDGFVIFDTSNPTSPLKVGEIGTAGDMCSIDVSGDYAYLASWGSGLEIIDISNPANPVKVGAYVTTGKACGVAVFGDYAYIADAKVGLEIFNISDPANPIRVGGYNSGYAYAVAVSGSYAYVTDYTSGLIIIDISNPANPQKVSEYNTFGEASGIAVAGNYVYVADSESGLIIFDVTNPGSPIKISEFDYDGFAYDITIVGKYAYIADFDEGLVILDISLPANPQMISRCNTTGNANNISLLGNYIYMAQGDTGFVIIGAGYHITGKLLFASYLGDLTNVAVRFGLIEDGSELWNAPISLDGNGKYAVPYVLPGNYDLSVKGSHWLRKVVSDVTVEENAAIDDLLFINGDVVDNNEVDFSDINAVRASYGSFPGDETWNAMADVDGSGEVDFTDINIVRSNYGEIGD